MNQGVEILRALAARAAECAADPVNAERAKLYRAVNDRHMVRPVVLLEEIPWNELAKEEALRARDQAFEQVEYELEEARHQHAAAEAARAELAAKEEKEAETHEQEMSGMLQSLNKKEEQLRELNESADHLEAVIRELRAELQRSGRSERR